MNHVLEGLSLPELRALVYQYAAKLLDYPYDEDMEKLEGMLQDFVNLLRSLEEADKVYQGVAEDAQKALKHLGEELKRLGRDMFQAEYVSTFELGVRGPLCPPYESEYVKPERIEMVRFDTPTPGGKGGIQPLEAKLEVMGRVLDFYNRYGVSVGNMPPDHLIVELEFMYYLVCRELEALKKGDEKEAARYREAQLRFLREHLLKWIDRLATCVEEKSPLKTYAGLLSTVARFVACDEKLLSSMQARTA